MPARGGVLNGSATRELGSRARPRRAGASQPDGSGDKVGSRVVIMVLLPRPNWTRSDRDGTIRQILPAYLTVGEVAELLRPNQQTVRNWIDRGELPAVRVGERRVRIRQSDLDEFLAAGATARDAKDDAIAVAAAEEQAGQWARLGTALADSTAALVGEDHGRLAEALNSLADAARGLAEVLSEREIRSDGSAADQRAE